jgi:hypothetical protein
MRNRARVAAPAADRWGRRAVRQDTEPHTLRTGEEQAGRFRQEVLCESKGHACHCFTHTRRVDVGGFAPLSVGTAAQPTARVNKLRRLSCGTNVNCAHCSSPAQPHPVVVRSTYDRVAFRTCCLVDPENLVCRP